MRTLKLRKVSNLPMTARYAEESRLKLLTDSCLNSLHLYSSLRLPGTVHNILQVESVKGRTEGFSTDPKDHIHARHPGEEVPDTQD